MSKNKKINWIMTQTWTDLLFAHWPVSKERIRHLVPSQLEIDQYDKQAWISIVPLRNKQIRFRFLPPLPLMQGFPQINFRTYVTYQGEPSVYFFSLDTAHFLTAKMARYLFHLEYYLADIHFHQIGNRFTYISKRCDPHSERVEWNVSFIPTTPIFQAQAGSLDAWLTERYTVFTTHKDQLYRGDLFHLSWNLQYAEAEIIHNTIAEPLGILLSQEPALLHYSKGVQAFVGPVIQWEKK